MWSHIEVSVALISACLPTMRPLLSAFLGLAGSGWSNDEVEEAHNIREGAASEATHTKKWSNAGEWRLSIAYVDSDSSSIAEQGGSCKKMLLRVIQIQKADAEPCSSEGAFKNNENIC
ncbi:hypothetical protein ES702_02407 [subsurface metagenome]